MEITYILNTVKKVNDTAGLDENSKDKKLNRSGGVSIFGLFIVFVIVFIVTGIYVKYNPAPF